VIDPIYDSRPPELDSDLEWMLQSGQATHEMLAETLVQEFYLDAHRFAMVFMDDPTVARSFLLDVFSNALLNVYHYRSQMGARVWFFRIFIKSLRKELPHFSFKKPGALQTSLGANSVPGTSDSRSKAESSIWMAFENLGLQYRMALFLSVVLDWPVEEIPPVIGADSVKINQWLTHARRNISALLQSELSAGFASEGRDALDELLIRSIDKKFPVEPLDEDARLKFVSSVLNRKSKRDYFQQRAVSIKEIIFTGLAILIVVGVIWAANRVLPDSESAQSPTETSQRPPAAAFQRRYRIRPTPTPLPHLHTPFPTPTSQGMFYELKPGETLSSVAARLGITAKALRQYNRLPADARLIAGDRIALPTQSLQSIPTPTPVTPAPTDKPHPTPSSSMDIMSALSRRNYSWQTLWMDAEILDYGPPGFVGPPEITRNQLWLSHSQFLDLIGRTDGVPDVVFLRNQESLYAAQPGIGQVWFTKMQSPSSISLLENQLNGLFGAIFFRSQDITGTLRMTGSDVVAGHVAWRVDQTGPDGNLLNRFWMEARTGFILGSQTFGGQDRQTLLSEVRVNSIFFDVNFPDQSMFDPNLPWRGGYASDYTGSPEADNIPAPSPEPALGHEPRQYIPALDGFNPGAYPLAFQYPSDYMAGEPWQRVDVFAGMYYLGKTPFGDPRAMICSRSTDGDWFAFVSQPSRDPGPNAQLHLINLRTLDQITPDLPGPFSVTQFAISPDNQQLAFFGYNSQFDPGGLYLMDLETGEVGKLMTMASARSLVWSPDGKFLGLVGLYENQQQEDVVVLDVRDSKITYSEPFAGNNSAIGAQSADNWPMKDWGVDFPVSMDNLGDCVNPPGK
jgi:DNA-directed RNA polymerase specialized sigma24 family protein